tara:strand:- start:1105 stop:1500 length:396 start_codon:yes stop_codon:yes gene_type:complete
MDIEKVFKNIVLLDFVIFVLLFISIIIEPEEITNISDSLDTGIWDENTIALIFIGFLIVYLINLILLYKFVSFGKVLYSILFILGIVLPLTTGPIISSSFTYTLEWIGGATSGAILVLLYFSPIKDKFIKQ